MTAATGIDIAYRWLNAKQRLTEAEERLARAQAEVRVLHGQTEAASKDLRESCAGLTTTIVLKELVIRVWPNGLEIVENVRREK